MSKIISDHKSENQNNYVAKNNSDLDQIKDKSNWEQTKLQISKIIKEIVWKAWIEPLGFIEYKNHILYISSSSSLISNRAETQYYETIFFEASKYFENIKEFKILKINDVQAKKILSKKNDDIDLDVSLKTNFDISSHF